MHHLCARRGQLDHLLPAGRVVESRVDRRGRGIKPWRGVRRLFADDVLPVARKIEGILKATHGLVPYTGVMPIELTIDPPRHAQCEDWRVATSLAPLRVASRPGSPAAPTQLSVSTDKWHPPVEGFPQACGEAVKNQGLSSNFTPSKLMTVFVSGLQSNCSHSSSVGA